MSVHICLTACALYHSCRESLTQPQTWPCLSFEIRPHRLRYLDWGICSSRFADLLHTSQGGTSINCLLVQPTRHPNVVYNVCKRAGTAWWQRVRCEVVRTGLLQKQRRYYPLQLRSQTWRGSVRGPTLPPISRIVCLLLIVNIGTRKKFSA